MKWLFTATPKTILTLRTQTRHMSIMEPYASLWLFFVKIKHPQPNQIHKIDLLQRKLQSMLSRKWIRILHNDVIASVFNMCGPYLECCFNIISCYVFFVSPNCCAADHGMNRMYCVSSEFIHSWWEYIIQYTIYNIL